jgi:hypothetical protein
MLKDYIKKGSIYRTLQDNSYLGFNCRDIFTVVSDIEIVYYAPDSKLDRLYSFEVIHNGRRKTFSIGAGSIFDCNPQDWLEELKC